MPAEQDQPFFRGKYLCDALIQRFPSRGKQDSSRLLPLQHGLHAVVDGLCHHHQPRTAAEGIVVGFPVFIVRVIADIVHTDVDESVRLRAPKHARGQNALEHLRKQRENVNPQSSRPPPAHPR
ncbi:hypothetical protein SDC9_135796 [bioreactor metagenome]|uniref:Uncharacterized protein n=1 Tax=bioreactor metagenome TaxID=1076179 RepID=A0A645DJE8_9ZZZZ